MSNVTVNWAVSEKKISCFSFNWVNIVGFPNPIYKLCSEQQHFSGLESWLNFTFISIKSDVSKHLVHRKKNGFSWFVTIQYFWLRLFFLRNLSIVFVIFFNVYYFFINPVLVCFLFKNSSVFFFLNQNCMSFITHVGCGRFRGGIVVHCQIQCTICLIQTFVHVAREILQSSAIFVNFFSIYKLWQTKITYKTV